MIKRIILSLCILTLISACSLPTATEAAADTPTSQAFYPTGAAVSTLPPFIPTPTATPDLRVITAPAKTFKLTLADLPGIYSIKYNPVCLDLTDPQCKLATDRIEGPELNYEILQSYGFEQGSAYINNTKRVEGWYIVYTSENEGLQYPQIIISNPIRFTDASGARKFVEVYAGELLKNYTKVEGYLPVGDTFSAHKKITSNSIYFTFVFSYKNMAHKIGIIGQGNSITPILVHELASKALMKLQAAESDFASQYASPPTLTPSADASPAPEDRVAPKLLNLALSQTDLPAEGSYKFFDKDTSSPYHNSEVTQKYSSEQASAYITETGRVDGWEIRYRRGANNTLLPSEMSDVVTVFQTAEGAQKYINDFAAGFLETGYQESAQKRIVGDATRLFTKQDGVFVKHMLIFSYRNYVHELQGYGLQAEVDPAVMEMVAFTLLQKLQSIP
ncbi:MAG: hypothetical protein PHQ36_02700 [Anaerolineales bacterium]|nr:hypothetical protein [Anaerolineales bacterium]